MRLAVFDADAPPSLAFISSAGKLGISVDVYSHHRFPPARASRHCRRFFRAPNPTNLDAFLPWLEREIDVGNIECIAPTSDLIAFAIAMMRSRFPDPVKRALPTLDATLRVLMKDRMTTMPSSTMGLPFTLAPRSEEEARERADEVRYPAIIKPRSHVHAPWARGLVVDSADELRTHYRRIPNQLCCESSLAMFPEVAFPVVQELIKGPHLVSVSGVLVDGKAAAIGTTVKTMAWPPPLGVGLLFHPIDHDERITAAIRYAEEALVDGIFELEFIDDERTGQSLVLDLNPRAFGQIRFDIARGRDLPALWLARVFAKPPPTIVDDATVTGWQHTIPLAIARGTSLMFGPNRVDAARTIVDDARAKRVDIVADRDDPLPGALYVARMLRHPGGLIRPFVKTALAARRPRA